MTERFTRETLDPHERTAVFDAGSHLHLADAGRDDLLENVDAILGAVASPDARGHGLRAGTERSYRQDAVEPSRWLRVVVDFNSDPGWIVTAFFQYRDPRQRRP
jgi:hypothetical protein